MKKRILPILFVFLMVFSSTAYAASPRVAQVVPGISFSGTKAVGVFNLYKEGFWGDTLSSSATITVSCNQNGKTNCEFNGDEAVN